jgi:hypothetical protein
MKRNRGLIGFGSYEMVDRPVTRTLMSISGPTFPTLPTTCDPCPPGQSGCAPYCYALPTWGGTSPTDTNVPGTGGSCPAGQVGIPPACVSVTPVTPATAAATTTTEEPSPSWWQKLNDTEKWVVVGIGSIGGIALLALLKGAAHKRYAANYRSRPSRGPIALPTVKGKRWGRRSAPKKYRSMGAKYPSDYAFPAGFMYPVVFRHSDGSVNVKRSRRHVASGKGYFTKHKRSYPVGVRRTIAKNLNRAARRFGLRPDVRA